jgi:SnoaL-like domain
MSAPVTSPDVARQATRPSPAVEAWVADFIEGWRAPADADAFVDHFSRVLHPQVRLVQPQMPNVVGLAAFRERFARPLFTLIPDVHGEVERWSGGEDFALIELRLSGTLGGRPVSWTVVDRVTIQDGLAVERVSYLDPTPLLLAVATRPRAWPRFLRMRLAEPIGRLRARRSP